MVQDIYTLLFKLQSEGAPTISKDMGTATKSTTGYDTATKNATKSSGNATKALTKQDTAVKAVNKSSKGATTAVRSFGGGMQTTLLGIGSLTQGVVSLQRSWRDLPDAQGRVDKANLKLSKSKEALETMTKKLTEAEDKFGKNSPEYEAALLNQQQAQEQLGIATFNADEAQENFNDTQTNFYTSLLPIGIGLISTLGSTLGPLKGALFGAAGGMTGMSKAGRILNTVLRFSPLFLLIGALIAIKTNAFGFRDALSKLGEKIGSMFPQLRGFLNWVKDLATALGLAEGGPNFGKAFDLLKSGFQSAVQTITTTDWGAVIDTIGQTIQTALTNFNWSAAWQGFKLAMFAAGTWIAPRVQEIGAKILEAIQAYDWAGAWKEFQDSMYNLGVWIAPHIQSIGAAILAAIQAYDWVGAWATFRAALFATGAWVGQQIVLLGGLILTAIQEYDWVGAWATFRAALFATGKWVGQQLLQIAGLILTAIQNYDWVTAWTAFRAAMWATGKWVGQQMLQIAGAILKTIQNYDWVGAWAAFRAAMWATGKWVGQTLLLILNYIKTWWGKNKSSLTAAFFGFFDFLYKSATTAAGKIVDLLLKGIKNAASKLKSAGSSIWNAIKSGIKSLIPDNLEFLIPGLAKGGLIQSAASGKIFTTRGPTLTMAGDNPGGKETVAYIPHNNPMPTLKSIMKVFGNNRGFNMGTGIGQMGGTTAIIHIHVHVGGRTTEEIIKQVEIGLGKNMRSIAV